MELIAKIYFLLDLNLIGNVWGLLGSASLVRDIVRLTPEKILNRNCYDKSALTDFLEDIKPQLEKRLDTIWGAFFILLSYTCQLISTIPELKSMNPNWWTSIFFASSVILTSIYLKDWWQKRIVRTTRKQYGVLNYSK